MSLPKKYLNKPLKDVFDFEDDEPNEKECNVWADFKLELGENSEPFLEEDEKSLDLNVEGDHEDNNDIFFSLTIPLDLGIKTKIVENIIKQLNKFKNVYESLK